MYSCPSLMTCTCKTYDTSSDSLSFLVTLISLSYPWQEKISSWFANKNWHIKWSLSTGDHFGKQNTFYNAFCVLYMNVSWQKGISFIVIISMYCLLHLLVCVLFCLVIFKIEFKSYLNAIISYHNKLNHF